MDSGDPGCRKLGNTEARCLFRLARNRMTALPLEEQSGHSAAVTAAGVEGGAHRRVVRVGDGRRRRPGWRERSGPSGSSLAGGRRLVLVQVPGMRATLRGPGRPREQRVVFARLEDWRSSKIARVL